MIIKEYLVRLGVKDSFTDNLGKLLGSGTEKVSGFVGKWGKQWAIAGGAVVTGLVTANVGVAKFLGGLVKADDELTMFARQTWRSRDEAYKTKSALDAMGKSLEEIRMNPRLLKEYRELRANAEKLKPPDMTEGLNQVRAITTEFNKLKQLGGAAIQWVGFYLLKHIQNPMRQIKDALGGIDDKLTLTLPVWTEKIAKALSWIVRLGSSLIRGAAAVFDALKRIFDMIPGNVKTAIAAFAALALFIRAGPVGKLIAIISLALLLLEDFFTYLDGGDAKLAGLWKSLTDIWKLLRDSGVLEKLKESAQAAFQLFSDKLNEAKVYLGELYEKFRDSGAIEKFKILVEKLGKLFTEIAEPIVKLGGKILSAFTGGGKKALDWFVTTGLPKLIGFVSDAVGFVGGLLGKLNDMKLTVPIIGLVTGAFVGLKVIDGITESVKNLTGFIEGISKADKAVGKLKELKDSFGSLKDAVGLTKLAQEANNVMLLISAARSGGLAGAQVALAGAEGSATVAQWALNVAMSMNPIALIIIAIVALIAIGILLVKNWDKVKAFFISLWDSIKKTFSNIGGWFSEKFTQAKDAVFGAFESVGNWFREKAAQIINAFLNIPQEIRATFAAAVENVKNVFTELPPALLGVGKDLITSLWNGVLSMGSWLKGKVKNFFTGIWDGVKGTFSDEGSESTPSSDGAPLPGHKDGGIFGQEHVARFAEDNKPEAVVPLSNPSRAREVMAQAARFMGTQASSGAAEQALSGMKAFLEKASSLLSRMEGTLKSGAAPISNSNIVNDNRNYDMKTTYKIYDSSGNPQSTATAVDRQQQMRIRNLQGAIV